MSLNKPNSATELYEEYKTIISHHSNYICKLKIKVSAIIAKRQLVSFMNDIKWLELQYAVKNYHFRLRIYCDVLPMVTILQNLLLKKYPGG